MARQELVRLFTLDAFADDRENLEQIAEDVNRLASDCGLTIELSEIVQALEQLVKGGFANLYRYDVTGRPPDLVFDMPLQCTELMDKCYCFQITERGMELEMAEYEGWPFNSEGVLKDGWERPRS